MQVWNASFALFGWNSFSDETSSLYANILSLYADTLPLFADTSTLYDDTSLSMTPDFCNTEDATTQSHWKLLAWMEP